MNREKGITLFLIWNPSAAYCKMDFIVEALSPSSFLIVIFPAIVFDFLFSATKDFDISRVLRQQARRKIFACQEKRYFVQSVKMVLFVVMIPLIFLPGSNYFNWDQSSSIYAFFAHDTLKYSRILVYVWIIVANVLRIFILQNIMLFSMWRKNSPFYGIILVGAINIVEMISVRYKIVLNCFSISYSFWQSQSQYLCCIVFGILYCLAGSILYYSIVKKKEYLHT